MNNIDKPIRQGKKNKLAIVDIKGIHIASVSRPEIAEEIVECVNKNIIWSKVEEDKPTITNSSEALRSAKSKAIKESYHLKSDSRIKEGPHITDDIARNLDEEDSKPNYKLEILPQEVDIWNPSTERTIIITEVNKPTETTEEAAKREYDDNLFQFEKYRTGFLSGSTWQKEQTPYSKEDMIGLINFIGTNYNEDDFFRIHKFSGKHHSDTQVLKEFLKTLNK